MLLVSFAALALIAFLTDLPLWMIGLAAAIAFVGYLLEGRPPR